MRGRLNCLGGDFLEHLGTLAENTSRSGVETSTTYSRTQKLSTQNSNYMPPCVFEKKLADFKSFDLSSPFLLIVPLGASSN